MTATLFVPKGLSQLDNELPQLKVAELKLRAKTQALGIEYDLPDFAGLRTPADTVQLISYRDQAVAQARAQAEAKRKAQGGNAVQIKDAGDVAASRAYYRVSPAPTSYHTRGAAFDIRIRKVPAGMTVDQGYKALGAAAASCGLRWGGTFSAPADVFHFELLVSLNDATALWTAYTASSATQRSSASVTPIVVGVLLLVIGGSILATHR